MNSFRTALLGSVGSAAFTLGITYAAGAIASPLPAANSYADLLEPAENAQAVLFGDDLARMQQPKVRLAQFDGDYHHHHHRDSHDDHHHHHHRFYDDHHHHHHHHHGFGFGVTVVPPWVRHCYIQRRVYFDDYGERIVRRYRVCD